MIGRVGLAEHRKAVRMFDPIELSTVDDRAAETCAMSSHELRQ